MCRASLHRIRPHFLGSSCLTLERVQKRKTQYRTFFASLKAPLACCRKIKFCLHTPEDEMYVWRPKRRSAIGLASFYHHLKCMLSPENLNKALLDRSVFALASQRCEVEVNLLFRCLHFLLHGPVGLCTAFRSWSEAISPSTLTQRTETQCGL